MGPWRTLGREGQCQNAPENPQGPCSLPHPSPGSRAMLGKKARDTRCRGGHCQESAEAKPKAEGQGGRWPCSWVGVLGLGGNTGLGAAAQGSSGCKEFSTAPPWVPTGQLLRDGKRHPGVRRPHTKPCLGLCPDHSGPTFSLGRPCLQPPCLRMACRHLDALFPSMALGVGLAQELGRGPRDVHGQPEAPPGQQEPRASWLPLEGHVHLGEQPPPITSHSRDTQPWGSLGRWRPAQQEAAGAKACPAPA